LVPAERNALRPGTSGSRRVLAFTVKFLNTVIYTLTFIIYVNTFANNGYSRLLYLVRKDLSPWSQCCTADRAETMNDYVDSDVNVPSDTVQRTIRKLELVSSPAFLF